MTYGTPLQSNPPLSTLGTNPNPIGNPGIRSSVPYYPPQSTNPLSNPAPLSGNPMRSPSDGMTSPRGVVNSAPFVSSPPCQFDAAYMVSPRVYRQAVDPCAQPGRGTPYAPSPYATSSGGSPFAYAPPTAMPYGYNSGYRPLIGFGQSLNNAYLGRGIIGQPTAYVDGQPVRNFLRYLFP